MNTITINKNVLLPILIENKRKHDDIYNAAVSGYWQTAETVLTDKLEKVKNKEQIDSYLGLNYPVTYENDYNRAIQMLQLTSDDKVDLDFVQFDSYVRNQWTWKSSFLNSNSTYITGSLGILCSGFSS